MKWPGLIPLLGRIIAFPFVVGFFVVGGIFAALDDGLEWWLKVVNKDNH